MNKNIITEEYNVKKHSIIQSILYHILPGAAIASVYFLLAKPLSNIGYPSIFALVLAGLFVLVPLELGIIYYQKQELIFKICSKYSSIRIVWNTDQRNQKKAINANIQNFGIIRWIF